MDHDEIARRNVADLYLAGELPAEESAAFEEHFFDCRHCQDELEVARKFRAGMRAAGSSPVALAPRGWLFAAMGAAAAILVLAVPAWIFYQGLNTRVREASQALAAERASHQGDLARLTVPQTGLRIFRLDVLRSQSSAATIALGTGWTVLAIPQPPAPEIASYRAHLENAAGASVWQQDGLQPDPLGSLTIAFAPGWLSPGDYRLSLESLDRAGRAAPAGQFALHIVKP